MRISVDLGFGFTKAINENGKKISFPSVVSLKTSKIGGGLSSGFGGEKDDYTVVMWNTGKPLESKSYYIGDAAMTTGGVRTWDDNVSANVNARPLVCTACSLISDGTDIDLCVGLPMTLEEEEFEKQVPEIKKALIDIDVTVNIPGNGTKKVKVKSVFVGRQGQGAYYSACLSIDGKIKDIELIKSPVGIIDPGQRTTDFLIMTKGKKGIVVNDELSGGADNLGMNLVYKQVQNYASELAGKEIDLLKIEQAIMWDKGILNFRGKRIELNKVYNEACENLAEQIAAYIKGKWGNEIDYLAKIFICGGGGEVLYKHLIKHFPNAVLLDSYANAEGYLAFQALITKKAS